MGIRRSWVLASALSIVVVACSGTDSATASSEATTAPSTTATTVAITTVPATTTTVPAMTTTVPATTTTTTSVTEQLGALGEIGFDEFLETSYEILLLRGPQFLTSLGIAEQYGLGNGQLDDLSPEYLEGTQQLEVGILDRLRDFDRAALSDEQRLSFDLYAWYLDQQVKGHRFAYHDYPLHHFVNGYNFNTILFLSEEHQVNTVQDAEDYVSRLSHIDDQVAQVLERLRISEGMGVTPPQSLVGWTVNTLQGDLGGTDNPLNVRTARLPLYTTFAERLEGVAGLDEATRLDLLERAEAELVESFVPAWVALIEHLREIEPTASPEAGVWRLPDGDEYYEWLLRDHTSTDLSPDEVHHLGLEQVERVQTELRAAFAELEYPEDDSINDLRGRARDEAGYLSGSSAAERAELVAAYEALIVGSEDASRDFFGMWPNVEVVIVPDDGGGGYYVAPSVDGSRPGAFHAGTGGNVPVYIMPTISYHEAVPGHHTQIAISGVLELPTFRRFIQYNAYIEGWALYAEGLAAEIGLYDDDPYGEIGRLELELVRAARLVVDTGLHWKRWTSEEAHRYMDEVIDTWAGEVERYMVLPGQATGYMIGMLTILGLRGDASGPEELAAFHDLILGGGSMPLGVLEDVVGG
jgi:uncharacterized protein (DUF885 family)